MFVAKEISAPNRPRKRLQKLYCRSKSVGNNAAVRFVGFIVALSALLICAQRAMAAADVHPIVEVQSGYLFGATSDGKWIKAEEASKALTDEYTYRIYGLTQSFGEARGAKPTSSEEDVCSDVL